MAEAAPAPAPAPATAPAEGAAPATGKKTKVIAALAVLGGVLGGIAGGLVLAPRVIAGLHPAATREPTAGSAVGVGAGGESEGGGARKMVELSNIIVNPAGSQGTRFLMTSVAISVTTDEAQKLLSERQVELRDRITSILETQTMAQLTAPGARDTLKVRIAGEVSGIVGPKVPLKVFLPQFVIQ
jgi:flagellar protein FliL